MTERKCPHDQGLNWIGEGRSQKRYSKVFNSVCPFCPKPSTGAESWKEAAKDLPNTGYDDLSAPLMAPNTAEIRLKDPDEIAFRFFELYFPDVSCVGDCFVGEPCDRCRVGIEKLSKIIKDERADHLAAMTAVQEKADQEHNEYVTLWEKLNSYTTELEAKVEALESQLHDRDAEIDSLTKALHSDGKLECESVEMIFDPQATASVVKGLKEKCESLDKLAQSYECQLKEKDSRIDDAEKVALDQMASADKAWLKVAALEKALAEQSNSAQFRRVELQQATIAGLEKELAQAKAEAIHLEQRNFDDGNSAHIEITALKAEVAKLRAVYEAAVKWKESTDSKNGAATHWIACENLDQALVGALAQWEE